MKIPIAFKLVFVTLGLILAASVPIAQKSAELFETVSRQREEDSNRGQAERRANEVEGTVNTLMDSTIAISALAIKEKEKDKKELTQFAFQNDRYIVALEVIQYIEGQVETIIKLSKNEFFRSYGQKPEYVETLKKLNPLRISEVLTGSIRIVNSSNNLAPILTMHIPVAKDKLGKITHIAIAHIKLARLQRTFSTVSERTVFLLDKNGIVLAHPDESQALAMANYQNHPAFEKVKGSEFPLGQLRYYDKDSKTTYVGAYARTPSGMVVISTASEEIILEPSRLVKRQAYFITGLLLSGALFFIFLFSITISSPIEKLVYLTKRVARGDFNFRARHHIKTADEVGDLARSFDSMIEGLVERDKVKSLFGKFHGTSIAEDLLKKDIGVGGTNKEVTVFFSDIRGFTAFSEGRTPEEVVLMLNEYFAIMVKTITQHKGIVDKFIGDAIMAVWGAPKATPEDAHNAVQACLEMRKNLNTLNEKRIARNQPPIKIGMGLHSGNAISGTIGSEERMEYTVIGDTVNMASRIESSTKAFGTDLLISEETMKKVNGNFKVIEAGSAEVKGKTEALKLFKVHGYKDSAGNFIEVVTPYSEYTPEKADKVKIAA